MSQEPSNPDFATVPILISYQHGSFLKFYSFLHRCITQFENGASGPLTSIMTSECNGRLGNQMFSYAYLYAFATFNKREAYMSAVNSNLISKYFKVSLDTMDFNLSSSVNWTFHGHAPGNFKALSTATNHKFCHNPQVRRYFDDIQPHIQREFQFHDEIQRRAQVQLSKAHLHITGREMEVFYGVFRTQFVGLHVRRSDYMSISFPATAEFYYSAMMYFHSKYSNTIFVVASEDLVWCKESFSKFVNDGFRIYYLEGVSEDDGGLDMAVLVNCDHLIFGVGSFGFWAGYLNSGEVIYCSDCVNNGTVWRTDPSMYEGDYGNFVKPSWKGMSNTGKTTITV